MRIDKWLWFCRFYKTRVLATKAVAGGHVKVNGVRAKSSTKVSNGDSIALVRDQLAYEFEVLELPLRRGPATEARRAYSESDESIQSRENTLAQIRADRRQMPRTDGRPDKHTRRILRNRNRNTE